MRGRILDGNATAWAITQKLASEIFALAPKVARSPSLATVLIGDDPASHTYVQMKINRCKQVGIRSQKIELPETTTTEEAVAAVRSLSENPAIDGILVQHPAPPAVDEAAVFAAIDPAKDVDGVTSNSLAAMAFDEDGFRSATPGGIMRLLEHYGIEMKGTHAVVVGRSRILGIPMGLLLLAQNATVTYCHSRTSDLQTKISGADLVVAATGRPELVKGSWIKEGAVVIDAGYSDMTGDVEYDSAAERASWITPVPGGVGPMTIACLLEQTVKAHKRRNGLL